VSANRIKTFLNATLPLWLVGLAPVGTVNFIHLYPIPTFIEEWFAAACLSVTAILVLFFYRHSIRQLPGISLFAVALAVVIIGQAALGMFADVSRATYLLLMPLLIFLSAWVGSSLSRELGATKVLTAIFAGLICTSFLQLTLQLLQVTDITNEFRWLMNPSAAGEMSHGNLRAFGHMGQPNLLASLHCLSIAGLAWFYRKGAVKTTLAAGAFACLVMGLTLTGSRIGALELCVALVYVPFLANDKASTLGFRVREFASLLLILLAAYFMTRGLGAWLDWSVNSIGDRGGNAGESTSFRFNSWLIATRIWRSSIWLGSGLNSFGSAELGFFDDLDHVEGGINAHNFVLHLLAETGLIGTILILTPLAISAWQLYLVRDKIETRLGVLVCLMFLLHCSVEFPYAYAYFLTSIFLLLGCVESKQLEIGHMPLAKYAATALILASVPVCAFSMFDFQRAASLGLPDFNAQSIDPTVAGAGETGASAASVIAEKASKEKFEYEMALAEAGKSVLFPWVADRVMLLMSDTGPDDVEAKLRANERSMVQGISPTAAFLQGIWLAQAGRDDDAIVFLKRFSKFVNGHADQVIRQVDFSASKYPALERFRTRLQLEFPNALKASER
jgi:hypothetical protein